LRFGDTVKVKTRVVACEGAALRRTYEFCLAGTGEVVARAQADSLFIDRATGRPAAIPPEAMAALAPDEPGMSVTPEPFPLAPPPPPGVFSMRRRVAWHDIDATQHVNDAAYLVYVEECGMGVLAAHSWPVARMSAEGFAIILRRHQIEYLQPALASDELELSTWASGVRRVSAMRHYMIHRVSDGALLMRVHTLGVWVDLRTGRPIRIPGAFLADFAPNIVAADSC
jgi:acyl-CoA thioester hydrolase